MEQLPESERNSAVSIPGSVHCHNELTKLPETETFDTASERFYSAAVEVLPPNIRGGVKELAQNQHNKYSRFEIFACALVIFIICAVVAGFIFPPPPELISISDNIPASAIVSSGDFEVNKNSEEGILLKKMVEHFNAGRYAECIALLSEEKIFSIISSGDDLDRFSDAINYRLNAVCLANKSYEAKKQDVQSAIRISRRLVERNPDSPAWHIHKLRFENYDIVINNSFEKIRIDRRNGAELDRLEQTVRYIENIKIDRFDGNIRAVFDLVRCKIYVACWLNYLPYDDTQVQTNNNNGVREREKAYAITVKYADNNPEFLAIQEFIVRKMIAVDSAFKRYDFNGQRKYSDKFLKNELIRIEKTREKLLKTLNREGF